MRGRNKKIGLTGACAASLTAVAMVSGGVPALAQNKDLSDRSVQVLMQYAWALTPPKFTAPDGKTIQVDKTKPKDAMVPLDVAREVIKVGRLSAHAQSCGLTEEQRANYLTLMRREQAKSTWSDPQLLYISQLHTTTVMMMTGKLLLVEKEGEKVVAEREIKPGRAESCTDTERQKVKAQITTYINTAAPAGGPPSAGALQTGSTKK